MPLSIEPLAGFAWGRHRQVRTPPSSLSLQGPAAEAGNSRDRERIDPLRDDDVDCDMLANARNDGYAMDRVGMDELGWRTRRRAVWEKGIRSVSPVRASCLEREEEATAVMLTLDDFLSRTQGFHGGWFR